MKRIGLWLLVIFLANCTLAQEPIERIAFGSCSFQFGKQNIWKSVVTKEPQLWIWLGDIVYGDVGNSKKSLKDKYAQADANDNYQLLKQTCPIIATWDDHDYGANNALGDFATKTESRQIFLDFLKADENDPRRNQEGIYTSYTYGEGDRKVKVILLDTRYCCQHPASEADMLGEDQWHWLESELRSTDAKINIIGSSIQFVSCIPSFENWDKFPASQNRILNLIDSTGAKGVVFISGDVHFAETSRRKYEQVSYPIYDLTSSGLTHGNQVVGFKNPYRVGKSRFGYRNFGFIDFAWEAEKLVFTEFNRRGISKFKHEILFSELGW